MLVLAMALPLALLAVVLTWSAVLLLAALVLRREFLPAAALSAPWCAESLTHLSVLFAVRVFVI